MEQFLVKNSHYGAYPQGFAGVFCNNLKNKLKHNVKGEIKAHIVNDTLIVDIYGVNNIVFRYTQNNIYSEIVQGFASETCTQIIVKRYKRYILNLFLM